VRLADLSHGGIRRNGSTRIVGCSKHQPRLAMRFPVDVAVLQKIGDTECAVVFLKRRLPTWLPYVVLIVSSKAISNPSCLSSCGTVPVSFGFLRKWHYFV